MKMKISRDYCNLAGVEVDENGNVYTVELEISSSSTYMPSSSLDIYYSGTASN